MAVVDVPVLIDDPVNAKILAVSEDRISGFSRDPIGEIAVRSQVQAETVLTRLAAMLEAGVIRRVRQTMLSTSLAHGALVAWQISEDRLQAAFEYLFQEDPFSGHVVIRTADAATAGSRYRLWTTLKVPQGYSLEKHIAFLKERIEAGAVRAMPAKKLFTLGVGHVRRRGTEPGQRSADLAVVQNTDITELDETEWRVLTVLKREFAVAELTRDLWVARAREAEIDLDGFYRIAESLQARGVVGRFSTFLEHVKPTVGNQRVTRYNALFHWQVPPGREIDAGREVGRHDIMTHAYWREGGPEFRNVNVMGVAHGMDKDLLLAHKAAIDEHLREAGIEIGYTNVFWGGRSEIKPSEISPLAYAAFCRGNGIDPEAMRA
jgi:DNA-binding Lrp family transcriptional regulator